MYNSYIYGKFEDASKMADSLNLFGKDYIVKRMGKNYTVEEIVKEVPPFPMFAPKIDFKNPITTLEI